VRPAGARGGARAADEAKDAKAALDYLDRACAAGAPTACAESGDRWLQGDLRDPARAIAALQRGCDAANAAACVRLARVYEEGDGAPPNAKTAVDLREKACAAGDGKSCRRLAGMSEEPARVADLLRKGCDGGDALSCALSTKEPAIVQRQLQEAAAGAAKPAPIARPASTTEKPAAKPPPPPSPRTEVEPSHDRAAAGMAMVAFGALAATAAVMMNSDDAQPRRAFRSALVAGSQPQSGSNRTLTLVFGGAAALSAGAGLVLLFTKPDKPEAPKVGVGVSPAGVVVSGNFR